MIERNGVVFNNCNEQFAAENEWLEYEPGSFWNGRTFQGLTCLLLGFRECKDFKNNMLDQDHIT